MTVDINEINSKLVGSFRENPIFNENNINKEGTVEYKTSSYVLKLKQDLNFDLSNFYERLKSLKLESLSSYSNSGFVTYEVAENTGKISLTVLKNDEENKYNIDNIFTQLALMISTSCDNYYGFGNVRELDALNKGCSYMIASNIAGSSEKTNNEEVLMLLSKLDIILTGVKARIDFLNAYFSNNGEVLKQELNKIGITDDILNEINYLHEAINNGLSIPDRYASISKKINGVFYVHVLNGAIIDKNLIKKYEALLLNDKVLDNSYVGITEVTNGTINAIRYAVNKRSNIVNINDYRNGLNVMQKSA